MILLRALAFNAYFFGLTTILGVVGLFVRILARRHIFGFARFWAGLVVGGARVICDIKVVVTGLETLPPGAALLASQHQSAFDTLVWMGLVPAPSYVVKQELTRIPLFGPLLAPAGMIPIDRRAGAAAMRGLLRAARQAQKSGRQLIIFPEGTRVAPGDRVPLQPGIAALAMHMDLPVIPVATDSGLRWGKRAFMKYPGTIHIAVGRPIPAGTARSGLLASIEAHWRAMESAGFHPVDNLVENPAAKLPVTVK
jgi:1-acyl-sn-glycerol-3-phosphate acyltransferase